MKISTKGRYGMRLMLDLALHHNGAYIPLKEVASRQELPEKYMEQIITPLSRAGYLRGVRGAQGGYQLTRNASDYTVGMILRTMEGDLSVVSQVEGQQESGDIAAHLVVNDVWSRINAAIEQVVDNITLAELVEAYNRHAADNYVI